MLWLPDYSNEGHIPALYHDDPGERIIFFRKIIEDKRWSAVAAELGCVPAGAAWNGWRPFRRP